jgi:hypothetical protein
MRRREFLYGNTILISGGVSERGRLHHYRHEAGWSNGSEGYGARAYGVPANAAHVDHFAKVLPFSE